MLYVSCAKFFAHPVTIDSAKETTFLVGRKIVRLDNVKTRRKNQHFMADSGTSISSPTPPKPGLSIFFSRVLRDSTPRFVGPSISPSVSPSVTVYFFGVNGSFGLIAPAQMFH